MARAKNDLTKSFTNKGDMLDPGCTWLLVSLSLFFFYCNSRTGGEGAVHPDTLVELPIDWLRIDRSFDSGFDSINGFVCEFINSSVIAFDRFYTHLNLNFSHPIVETIDIPKTFGSNAAIPSDENRNNVGRDFNIVTQHDNHSIVKAVDIPKTFESNIGIPRFENKNNFNSDFNIIIQNNNQHI